MAPFYYSQLIMESNFAPRIGPHNDTAGRWARRYRYVVIIIALLFIFHFFHPLGLGIAQEF